MRRKRERHLIAINTHENKQVLNLLGELAKWWRGLTTRQRIVLVACVLIVIGAVLGITIATMARFRLQPKERASQLRHTKFFRHLPSQKCAPLTEKPVITERNKKMTVTYLKNTDASWHGNLQFSYEDNLLDASYGETYHKADLRLKLRKLKEAVKVSTPSVLQKMAISGSEFRLVRSKFLYGAVAMVEPSSGNIVISVELDPSEYRVTLENEWSHVETRYVNLLKCGVELPSNKLLVFYPFINTDWTINITLRNELESILKNSHAAVSYFIDLHNDNNITSHEKISHKDAVNKLLVTAYQLPLREAFEMFSRTFKERLNVSETVSTMIGGLSHRLMEQVSDIREFPNEIRDYFYSSVQKYLDRYYALSCATEELLISPKF